MSGACAIPEPAPWVVRPFEADDENCVVSMWLRSYARSKDVAAWLAGRGKDPEQRNRWFAPDVRPEERHEELYYWRFHQPMVVGLVRGCETRVLCDPERAYSQPGVPSCILAWACVSPPSIVHYVAVKQDVLRAGDDLAVEMVASLLPDMLDGTVSYTFEQRDLGRMKLVPKTWKYDGRWLDGMKSVSAFARKHQMAADGATTIALEAIQESLQLTAATLTAADYDHAAQAERRAAWLARGGA